VADSVEGFVAAAQSSRAVGEAINLGTGREVSIGELAAKILKMIGRDLPIVTEDSRVRPGSSEVDRLCADNAKARRLLDWQPRSSLEDGLKQTIEWLKGNRDRYRPGVYAI
jgi:nucleoside-diphosphate-sugar epimerase